MTGFHSKQDMAASKLQEPASYLHAVLNAFGPDEGISLDQKGWSQFHAALKAVVAPQAQDPVALKIMMEQSAWDDRLELSDALANIDEFYATAPPQRIWIRLSDADIAEVVDTTCQYTGSYEEYLIKKAERKIRSMNT